jgi:hypothetical protein
MVCDRGNVLLSYTVNVKFQVTQSTTAPNGQRCVTPGLTWAPAAFFLHQLASSGQVTLNNATSSTQFAQSFAAIRRLIKTSSCKSWQGCASKLPQLASNDAAFGTLASVCSDFSSALDADQLGNGAFPVQFTNNLGVALPVVAATAGNYTDPTSGIVVSYDAQGRIITSDATNGHPFYVYVSIPIVERVLLSPLAFYDVTQDEEGMSSLTSFQLTYTLQSLQAARAIQSNTAAEGSILNEFSVQSFAPGFQVLTTWLTPNITHPRVPKTMLPYTSVQSYVSTGSAITATGSQMMNMQSVQLPQIPDRIVIAVTAPADTYNAVGNSGLSELNCPIQSISLSFGNVSGLCSSWTPYQLFTASKKAGLAEMSFPAWSGKVCVAGANAQGVGSILVLRPGIDFQLPAGAAPGQAGSWNISAQINANGCGIAMTPQVSLTCFYAGVLNLDELSGSTSTTMIGLSEAQVLEAMRSSDVVSSGTAKGMAAQRATGGFLGSLVGLGKSLFQIAAPHLIKSVVESGVKKAFGAGVTGAGHTGGGVTGGQMLHRATPAARMSLSDRLA